MLGHASRVLRTLRREGLRRSLSKAVGKVADRLGTSSAHEAEAARVRASSLFSAGHYLRQCPQAGRPGRDPVRHFVRSGWREGYDPHPLFSTPYYLSENPEVARAGVNPLGHYLTQGWREGRNPHPLFDTTYYLDTNPDVAQARTNPLAHYVTQGWREQRNPHPLFSAHDYLLENPDVARAGMDPLVHYLTDGWREGRNPHPLFSARHYLLENPDVARAGANPLIHYLTEGWREGRNPHPLFSAHDYLLENPDVARAGANPLVQYLIEGWREGRNPHPLFDTTYYLGAHPDVAQASANPLAHYVTQGWRIGHDPHPLFSTHYYLLENPDVARAGANPLVQYVTAGWREGRNPHPLFDSSYYLDAHPDVAQASVDPLVHYVTQGWRVGHDPHPLFDAAYYLGRYPEAAQPDSDPLRHFLSRGMSEGYRPTAAFDEELELPLPASAWEPGASRVERIVRTFFAERRRPVSAADAQALLREIGERAARQERLRAPGGEQPDASIVIPVYDQLKFTLWCLHAVLAGTYRHTFEIVVVDDGSQDGTEASLRPVRQIRYVRNPENRGFIHSCNAGAREARGEHLVFLNNDTLPLQGWLDALLDTFRDHPEAGIAGSKLIYPDGRLQEAGGIVWQNGAPWNYGHGSDRRRPEFNYVRGVDFCSGAALAVPAELFREAGGFDEAFAPAYAEDVDLAFRLKERGRAVLYQPLSEVVHVGGATAGTSTRRGVKAHQVDNVRRLFERWQLRLRTHRPEGHDPGLEKDRGAERRALFVDAFTPRPDQDAGSLDALRWMQALGSLGYRVTFLPHFDRRHSGRYTQDLQRQGIECLYEPYASVEAFLAAHGSEFDLCVFYRYETADALLMEVKRHAPQARRLLAVCDLAHVRMRRQAELSGSEPALRAATEARFRELLACFQCDAVWTPSDWEKELLVRELPGTPVLAWPLPQDVRAPRATWAERFGIGFIGGYRHAPNVDAVLFFMQEILPRVLELDPTITLHVAGSHMPPEIAGLSHPSVRVLGQVPDLGAFFEGLRASVAPIRFGAGMKGKVAASLAAGLPAVGTSLALEGMGLGPEEGVLLADDPRDFARQVVRLHQDEALWTRLSRAGLASAERGYSLEVGRRHLARALVDLGLRTRRADALLGGAAEAHWPHLDGMRVDVCRQREEHQRLRDGDELRRRVAFEEGLILGAQGGDVAFRARSFPAGRAVTYRARVIDRNGRPWCNWREELVCPHTGLNNRQRAMAAFAGRLIEEGGDGVRDVYLTEQVTPLFRWMSERYRTVAVTGSEYLGPGVTAGEVRDGVQHQDIERLSLPPSSADLILSCDVLEHVNEPQAALAEFARVLRPGGHLLFTVPFSWECQANRRRARGVGDSVDHLVEPCFHDNPLDPSGSLAYFDFGWELLDWVRGAGFADVSLICYWSDTLGHLGGLLEVFHAVR